MHSSLCLAHRALAPWCWLIVTSCCGPAPCPPAGPHAPQAQEGRRGRARRLHLSGPPARAICPPVVSTSASPPLPHRYGVHPRAATEI
jgi:hypothetical protein